MQSGQIPNDWQVALQSLIIKSNNIIQSYLEAVIQLTQAERGFVAAWNTDTQQWGFRALYNMDVIETTNEQAWWIPELLDEMMQNPVSIFTSNALYGSVSPHHPYHSSPSKLILRTVLAAPVCADGVMCGAIYVDIRLRMGMFRPGDLQIIEYAAEHLANML
jgi:GAF domain-containing protein